MVAWHSGRTSIFGRRTFPVLRLTFIWRVTSYNGEIVRCMSANEVDKWVVSCNRISAVVAPSGKCLRGKAWRGWLERWCVHRLLTAGPILFVSTFNGQPHLALHPTIGSCRSTATSMIVKRGWSGFLVRRAI